MTRVHWGHILQGRKVWIFILVQRQYPPTPDLCRPLSWGLFRTCRMLPVQLTPPQIAVTCPPCHLYIHLASAACYLFLIWLWDWHHSRDKHCSHQPSPQFSWRSPRRTGHLWIKTFTSSLPDRFCVIRHAHFMIMSMLSAENINDLKRV